MLRASAAFPMDTNRPVPIESRALGTLSYIRASIDAASSLAVPGMAGIVMGSIGIVAAVLASVSPFSRHWLALWSGAALLAFVLGGALMARQATRRGSKLLVVGPFRKFLLCLCPALLAGAVLTAVLWQAGLERSIPGMWLLLYGCAVVSSSTVTSAENQPLIAGMGAIFIVLGIATFGLPVSTHTSILGIGFGALHILFGILIGRARQGE